ncbi:MAG: hypothetical protein ACYC21_15350 [Eubacteriales bacterium]
MASGKTHVPVQQEAYWPYAEDCTGARNAARNHFSLHAKTITKKQKLHPV